MRQLRLRMPDETIRSIMVDENQPVANLMVLICTMLGITNHDEYSLIGTGKNTINGRRKAEPNDGRVVDQKMEQLKKKLKTDEDLAWLDHSKTLDEQEIHEQDVVILRRRFFYSDQNVDSRDPIQLGVLYVQTRDAILSGTHPVNVDGACKFAGIQCQAQLGDYVEGKTSRPGFFNLRDFLPAEYAKQKQIERKIFAEHKKYYGLSELEAKARYVNEARCLPTYGVTFFLVKEMVQGKNKLVPRLLGITRDCVMRVDADTKGILKTWPLTTVKRWAPSKNSFTLDFGDYSDRYYSVQTSEGEQISQLIAGYIDIILRRRKAKDHFGIEGDEGATMIEDSVAPSRATIIQNVPTLSRPPSAAPSQLDLSSVAGPTVEKMKLEQGPLVEPPEFKPAVEIRGKAEIGFESGPVTQYVTNYELSLPQRDLQDRLEQAQDAIEEAQKVLDKSGPEVDRSRFDEREVELKKSELSKQFANMNAATAQLVSLSAIPEEELDYPALNQAVETVASQIPTVAKDVKLVAALMEDEESGDRLIDAARRLCKAFSDLLNAAEPGPTVPRQILISAASRVGDATQALLFTINNDEDDRNSDLLLSLAKSVASSAAHLSLKAKDVASNCHDEEIQNMVISSATQCALATSQMVATAKIVAPTIHDAACQRKLMDACREVQRAVEGIQNSAGSRAAIRDQASLETINESVTRVNNALDELMHYVSNIRRQPKQQHHRTTTTTTSQSTSTTSHKLESSQDHKQHQQHQQPQSNELVNQARTLARATAKLIQELNPNDEDQHRESQEQNTNNERIHRLYHTDSNQESQPRSSKHSLTTITTTLYDDNEIRQQQQQQQQQGRPVSMYESEHHHQRESAYDDIAQRQREEIITTTTSSTTTREQQQHEQLPEAAISGIVGDLDTTIMFASTGTLRAQDENDNYLYHRENVLISAKALVEDTRPLVASASSDEAQLARAARDSVITMSKLAETVKSSAASLGPNQVESQVSLIRSVKDVAVSLSQLIGSTKSALGCDSNDPRLLDVKDSAKSMVSSVTSLLKTVKSVEEEQQRGLRVIEQTLEAIDQDLSNHGHPRSQLEDEPAQRASGRLLAEELKRVSRPVTMATSKSVHAASSGAQNDAIVAANMGRKAIQDLLQTVRQVQHQLDSYELRCRVHDAGRDCAVSYKHLLELLHRIFQHPSLASANPEIKQELIQQSKSVANCVAELVACSEIIRQLQEQLEQQQQQTSNQTQQHLQQQQSEQTTILTQTTILNQHQQHPTSTTTTTVNNNNLINNNNNNSNFDDINSTTTTRQQQWLDPHDPNVIAESELLGAASSIDAAARKLENLKPRTTSVKLPHEELNFDEIILEAAKSIIEATAALLRAASASQRELLVDGRLDETETFYASDNNQWSEGLVSAARMVAAATHSLVEAANALVQGQASEERLISAAKQVASSTNQLLVACKVKADPDSRTMTRLSNAGQHVKRATDNLVRAAQQAIAHDEEQSLIISNRKVSGIAQEISAREQILRKEKELQVAKTQLMAIRKAKYANRPDDYQGYGGSLS